MSNYIQYNISVNSAEVSEQLIAELNELNFEGFEEKENELIAFIPEELVDVKPIENLFKEYEVKFITRIIPKQNWNAVWEANFQPVVVNDFCVVRAEFHEPNPNVKYDIIITPKMSFGTGHHATTYMMIEQMQKLNFSGKHVADFGTGTGILAILAEKLGSASVTAIDYDDWCIENATENIERNACKKIEVVKADKFLVEETCEIVLANINKNVILSNLKSLSAGLAKGGMLLLSGLLKTDEEDIINASSEYQLSKKITMERNNWISILLQQVS